MTRAADLAQLHVNDALRPWPQAAFLATLMVAVSYAEAATDYPPPPGPYHSEPMVLPELPVTPQTSAGSTAEGGTAPQADVSSKRLAIPQLNPGLEPGAYDAANLFGNVGKSRQDDQRGLLQPLSNHQQPVIESPHPAKAEEDTRGFTMDFRRGNGGAAYRDVPRYEPAGAVYYGYPQYAPAYPGYGQYPGQGMHYAPPAAPDAVYPGYSAGHGMADPRRATGGQGFATPSPGPASYPSIGPGMQTNPTQAPYPTVSSAPDNLRQQDRSGEATGTTFRAVTPDAPSGASDVPADTGAGRPEDSASPSDSTMMFRPPELLPGR